MTPNALRRKINQCIDKIDERYLPIVYAYLKDFAPEEKKTDNKELQLLEKRITAYKESKSRKK